MYAGARTLRLADGPDEVHLRTVARHEIARRGRSGARAERSRPRARTPTAGRCDHPGRPCAVASVAAMARQLWLLRHGDAEPHATRPDAERHLTERGIEQAKAAGKALAALGVEPEVVLTSPKLRAPRDRAARLRGARRRAGRARGAGRRLRRRRGATPGLLRQ